MAAGDSLICPACGARNKPKWEFCVRCGESLQGVAPTRATSGRAEAEEAAEARPPSAGSGRLLVVVAGLLLVGLAVAAWRYSRGASGPARPDPGLFTVATRPSELPSPSPPGEGPGYTDFVEGLRLYEQQKAGEAVPFLARAAAAAPANARFRHVHAQALWAAGEQEKALAEYAEAARLDPGQYGLRLAQVYETLGNDKEALRYYEQALALAPESPGVRERIGTLLLKGNDYAKAVPHLEAASRARPGDPALQQDLAYALEMSGEPARAIEVYREILATAPASAELARTRLAELLFKEGKRDDAIALAQEGVRLNPDAPLLHRRLGSLFERTGRAREAATAYREYARLAPNAPDAKELAERAERLDAKGS
jgi:tetratricopeptide (TPR) repeat protein